MPFVELFIIAVGLSMDAFAVAICKGLSLDRFSAKKSLIVGAYFGFFQGFMPLLGYTLGVNFQDSISAIDHWIAFVLLFIIGFNMIREAFQEDNTCDLDDSLNFKNMITLAIATSIDALAIGITFAILKVNIIISASLIGIVTFIISIIGVNIGFKFGCKFKSKAECTGGVILILMGTKILFSHLGILL